MQNMRQSGADQSDQMANKLCELISYSNVEEFSNFLRTLPHPGEVCTTIDTDGETPIHLAIRRNRMNILSTIIELEVNLNCRNNKGYSPLCYALIYGHLKLAEMFINKGAQINEIVFRKTGKTLLHKMIVSNRHDAVQLLLKKGSLPDQADENGIGSLHYAVINGNVAIVKLLLEYGATINLLNNSNQSPLHLAITTSQPEIAKCLIEHGANVNLRNDCGKTLLQVAVLSSNVEITKQILKRSIMTIDSKEKLMGRTPLHAACSVNCYPIAKLLIKYGANVNFTTTCHTTPLHIASEGGEAKIVKLLIDHAVLVDKTTSTGKTPLMIAIENDHNAVVKVLIDAKANVNAKDLQGLTPLHYAAENSDPYILDLLASCGADINAVDNKRKTPLHHAIAAKFDHIGDRLIELGADVDVLDDIQMTPLDYKKLRVLRFKVMPKNKFQELFLKLKKRKKYN